jgi:adenosine deaminase
VNLVALPKVHLHIHLETSGPGGPLTFNGFPEFATHNQAVRDRLRTPADFETLAYDFCVAAVADGVRYAEVTFTAAAHAARLGLRDEPLLAVLAGLRRGRALGIETGVILDHSRRRPYEWAELTVALAAEHPSVVGFGVAGDETVGLASYAPLIARAADAGVRLVHHAGETAGAANVREAVELGRAVRIGHGIRVLEDPEVVALVRDRRVPLEVCPSSNVALGLAPSLADHPLPRLLDAGLAVTLNTDIPSVTGRPLSAEYAAMVEAYGWSAGDVAAVACAGVEASFAPPALKQSLRGDIQTWLETTTAGSLMSSDRGRGEGGCLGS